MITNKDIRVENGFLIINGDKHPLDGQSPETIMQIVEDNSDTTPTENSDAPITSGGVFAADKDITDTIGDLTQTGVTGASVAAQLEELVNVKTGTFTLDDTQSGANKNSLYIRQVGKVVTVQGYISGLTLTASTSVTIGVVSGVNLPSTELRLTANQTTAAYTMGDVIYVYMNNTTGAISILPKTTNDTLSFSFTYIAA